MAKVELIILGRNWIRRRRIIVLLGIAISLLMILVALLIVRAHIARNVF